MYVVAIIAYHVVTCTLPLPDSFLPFDLVHTLPACELGEPPRTPYPKSSWPKRWELWKRWASSGSVRQKITDVVLTYVLDLFPNHSSTQLLQSLM